MTAISAPSVTATVKPTAQPRAASHAGPYTVIENEKGKRVRLDALPSYVSDEEINLTPNSIKVLEKRYLRRDIDGTLLETPAGMFYRLAYHLAQVETEHGGDVEGTTETFYKLLTERRFYPNSPTFTGAGTPLGQLAACFVLPIEDDMGKSSDGIFSTLRVAALIQQTGGGNGFSFSRLRPKNDVVHTSAGRATGPVGFLRVYDQAFGEIAQGGSRRGANMGVLRVDHPDIEEFITCKAEEGKIANFNISVAITDEFMQAVQTDRDFALRNPRDGKVWKMVRARALFDKIVEYAHHNGEPGALFIDAANRSNPVPHLYQLEATNP
jgi:ribonucleoside-diphosphate reductase alpha chain